MTPHNKDSLSIEEINQRLESAIKNGNVSFISEVLAIEHLLPFQDKRFIDSVSKFLNQRDLDLLQITADAVDSGQDVFRVAHTLIQLFPHLSKVKPLSLLCFLKIYDEETKNDMMSGQLFEPIRKRAFLDKEWALDLEKAILENEDLRFHSYLLSIYLGLADFEHEFGFSKIRSAYSSSVREIKSVGLRGIGLLKKLPDEFKEEAFNAITVGSEDVDEGLAINATFSLVRLCDNSSELNIKRKSLSKGSLPSVRFEILRHLQFKQGRLNSDDIEIVKNLCAYDLNLKGITESLDSIVYFLLHKGQGEVAKEILTTWVYSHSFEEHKQYNFTELFNSSILELLKNKVLIETIFTEWFNADDFRFHHVLQEIVSYLGVHGVKNVELNREILKSFDDVDFLYIVRKILGYVYDFDISISLVLSILNLDSLSNKTATLVASVIIEHIGENYLFKTIERLNLEIESATTGTEKYKALKIAAQELEKKRDLRSALPNSNELMPNADHQAELNKAFNKSMVASMKQSRQKSVVFNLFTQVTIKEGLSTFSFNNGEYREPSKMGSFSHGVELPKKDVLDEVGASFERSGFRLAKRGEQ